MKAGYSTYSLMGALRSGMSIGDALRWMAAHGAEHVEIVPMGFDLEDIGQAVALKTMADACGLFVSNYAVSGDLIHGDQQAEVERLCGQVDIAHALGAPMMRFDNTGAGRPEAGQGEQAFKRDLSLLARSCRQVAQYAHRYGIQTMVENHGYYVNGSSRVLSLVEAVAEDNFGVLLDIGNMLCVDEDPLACVRTLLPYTRLVHVKDFYLRDDKCFQGRPGWFPTRGGRMLRGAIAGQGDLPVAELLALIKAYGFDGVISLEFEGIEDCLLGCEQGLDMVCSIWSEQV